MKTCKTCKYWTGLISKKHKSGICLRIEDFDNSDMEEQVYLLDAGRLFCDKDFGCTLHEVKDVNRIE